MPGKKQDRGEPAPCRQNWEQLKAEILEGLEASRRGDSLDEDEFLRQLAAENSGVFDDDDAAD